MRTYHTAQGTLLSALGDPNEKKIQKKGGIYEYIELIDFAIQQKSNTTF